MARFWASALGFELQLPPEGFATWREYWLKIGLPEDELEDGYDSIVDPAQSGLRIWFQRVPEKKSVKNRMHFDVKVGGGRSVPISERIRGVDNEVERLLVVGASLIAKKHSPEVDHYMAAMRDPEGNEFDVV
jgi:hypothetical protein